jgi:hypothetical protein
MGEPRPVDWGLGIGGGFLHGRPQLHPMVNCNLYCEIVMLGGFGLLLDFREGNVRQGLCLWWTRRRWRSREVSNQDANQQKRQHEDNSRGFD